MNFKRTCFFAFIFCVSGVNLSFSMDDLAKVINKLEAQSHNEKRRKMWEGFFHDSFKGRDFDKCVRYFNELRKFYTDPLVLFQSNFFDVYDKLDGKFLKKILKVSDFEALTKPMNDLRIKIQKTCRDKDAKECVTLLKQKMKLAPFELMEAKVLFEDIEDESFRNECKQLLDNDDEIEYQSEHDMDNKSATEKVEKSKPVLGKTELHDHVKKGDFEGVQKVLQSEACTAEYFNMQAGQRKIHVLHYAADRVNLKNGFEIAKLLIAYARNKNYDLNVKTSTGCMPLDIAQERDHKGLVELLTQQSAVQAA